jgi:FkbM family methyltransferase
MAVYVFDHIGNEISVKGRYEGSELLAIENYLAGMLRERSVADIGANIGNHSVFFSNLAAKVYSFEPNPVALQLLAINVRERPNVEVFPFGLGAEAATLRAFVPSGNIGRASLHWNDGTQGEGSWAEFHIRTLDSVQDVAKGPPIGLIKIDVEGHEASVLEGAKETIKRYHPLICFELNASSIIDGSAQTVEMLKSLGYSQFLSVFPKQTWRVGARFPAITKWLLRLVEALVLGVPDEGHMLLPVTNFEKRDYSIVVAVPAVTTAGVEE